MASAQQWAGSRKEEGLMIESELITPDLRKQLTNVARSLALRFRGVFGQETIEDMVLDSYLKRAANATIPDWLVVGTERFARERLEALMRTTDESGNRIPGVLFLCTHNAGRSQMAYGWFTHLARDKAVAWSAGSEPESEINREAVAAMAEIGIDISQGFPKPWTYEILNASDVVVTMGCGDACPLVLGKRYEDWEVDDPAGKALQAIRPIRDELGKRVRQLLTSLNVSDLVPRLAVEGEDRSA
jgi:protein-tyrosine-phosphatase